MKGDVKRHFPPTTGVGHSTADAVFSIGDFDSLDSAKRAAKQKAGTGTPIFIYNDRGEVVVRYGSWH
jgi:hypothetical protein